MNKCEKCRAAGWQPIETAPKGHYILAYNPDSDSVYVVSWSKSIGNGCWTTDGSNYLPRPTHWMPLPEPPEGK